MMALLFMKQKPSTQILNKGFTLIELVVSSLIASVVLLASLGLINQQREAVLRDQVQTEVSQNLRAAIDLIGADIKQAGARLDTKPELPGVSLIQGTAGDPDTLILQRRLLALDLSVCEDVGGNDSTITVAIDAVNNADDCAFGDIGPDTDGDPSTANPDGLTDNLNAFQDFRCAEDGVDGCARTTNIVGSCDDECVWAYIYDPVSDEGEFFQYSFEDENPGTPDTNRIYRGNSGAWQYTYEAANQPRIYLLEEREYSLDNDGILVLRINRQSDASLLSLVNRLEDFQVEIEHPALSTGDEFNPSLAPQVTAPPTWDNWQDIEHIQVDFITENPAESDLFEIDEEERRLSSKFFPRNVLSNSN